MVELLDKRRMFPIETRFGCNNGGERMTAKIRSERMGYEPVGKLLLQFSIPAIVGMVASALYNIVDRMFIGHTVGPQGIAAITVAFPFFLTIISTGMLIGVGSSSQISRNLGKEDYKKARRVMGNGVMAIVFFSILVMAGGFYFMDDLMRLCGASDAVMPLTNEYMSIILWGVPFQLTSFCLNYFIRAEGHPRYAMWTLILGAVANVILDWVFIVHFKMGVAGAALGTVIGQFLASCWVMSFYLRKVGDLHFSVKCFKPDFPILKEMGAVGFPPAMMEMFFVIVMILFNRILVDLGGDMAISAMGIFFSLDSLIFLPVVGIGEGVQPIVGFNYGAGNYDRCRVAVKLALAAGMLFFLSTFAIAQIFPRQLAMLFNKDSEELITLTVRAMRIGYLGMPVASIAIITGFVFQALGKAKQSLILNLCRQIFFLIPPLVILPPLLGTDGVWASFPIVDAGGGILGAFMIRAEMKRWNSLKKIV